MDKLVPKLYGDYGVFCNFRMLPNEDDGLLLVERRVLLSAFQIAKNKFTKSAKLDGYCLGCFHAHGLVYGTIVQMVYHDFLIGQGNFGIPFDENVNAASERYTLVRLNSMMEKLAFELVDYVPWKAIELDKEPIFLPVMFPLCLMGSYYKVNIGFGYKNYNPVYTQQDLLKRLLYLIGVRKTKPIIKPKSDCEILSSNKELESLLTTGKEKIKIRGIIEVNNEDFSISVKSIPPGKKIETLINKFKDDLENGDIGYNDYSDSKLNLVFKVIKQRNRQTILDNFKNKLENELTANIPFDIIVVDNDRNVKRISVDRLLLNAYNNYVKITSIMLENEKKKLEDILIEYNILETIRPILSKYLKKINENYDETIELISKGSKIDKDIIKNLFSKYRINKLLTLKIDKDEINNKIEYFDNCLNNVNDYVLDKYNNI